MPLQHAILGFLEYQPMTGYDLKKYFDQSISHFWSATQSHIYTALENLEKDGCVESQIILQEGKPNRKLYTVTEAGRSELRRWVSTPLPLDNRREAWLIQIFFAHSLTTDEIVHLFDVRIADMRALLSQSQSAQRHIDENFKRVGIERLRELWQLTLDYGVDYYQNEINWLEKTLPRIREIPALEVPGSK